MGATPPPSRPFMPSTMLRRRLAARLTTRRGAATHGGWTPLSGGRSAVTALTGHGPNAMVIKLTSPPPSTRALGTTVRPGHAVTTPKENSAASRASCPDAPGGLFAVDPALEPRIMAALSRRGLAVEPAAAFRHGPAICLAYPFQPGRTGRPPDARLARLLRRLHGLPAAALPPLPGPPPGRDALRTRALRYLAAERDGPALTARIAEAQIAARKPVSGGPVPLHGDPVPGNVVHGSRGRRLIDWHSAHRGDPCHDIAVALSPAMQVIHGLPPCTAAQRDTFLTAYGCPAIAARHTATAALHHALMIGHCLWRLDRRDAAYGPALAAEIAALRALPAI